MPTYCPEVPMPACLPLRSQSMTASSSCLVSSADSLPPMFTQLEAAPAQVVDVDVIR